MKLTVNRNLWFGLLFLANTTSAGLITYQGYTLDTDRSTVTGDGLEWLQWTETQGQSVEQAVSNYSALGWELASNTQMSDLFNDFKLCPFVFDALETTFQSCKTGYTVGDDTESESDRQFVELFGDTRANSMVSSVEPSDPFFGSYTIFGRDSDNDNLYNYAFVYDDVTRTDGEQQEGRVDLQDEGFPMDVSRDFVGVALVRTTDSVSVPAPATFALIGLGLAGLHWRRRKACLGRTN